MPDKFLCLFKLELYFVAWNPPRPERIYYLRPGRARRRAAAAMRPPSSLAVVMHDLVPMLDHQEAILELCCLPPSLSVSPASQLHCEQWRTHTVTFTLSL